MSSGQRLPNVRSPKWIGPVPQETPADLAEIPEASVLEGLSLDQVTTMLVAHWRLSVAIAVAIALVAAVAIKLMTKTYTAQATLIVNTLGSDPLAARAFPSDMLGNYTATQSELMLSPVILLPVVDRLNLTADKEFAAGFFGNGSSALREYVERNLAQKLLIDQGTGGQLLYVTASATNPVRAAQIANAVADIYLAEEQHRINGPARERANRYSTELAELRAKATAAQDKVVQFQQQHGITDLAAVNGNTEEQALENLEQQLLTAQSSLRVLEAQRIGQEDSASEVLNSQLVQSLKGQLNTEQAQLVQLRTQLGPKHPQVLEVESQITATREALSREVSSYVANNSTQISRTRELEAKLTQAVAEQRERVLNLRQLQDEGSKLLLERESAEAVYKQALDGYDQVLFAAVGNNTNVDLISRATPPLKPTKPNKPKLLALGCLAGLFIGLAGPFLYELLLNRRVRCRDDIERSFAIPVLAQFDALPPGTAST